jgi:hypothetical protein
VNYIDQQFDRLGDSEYFAIKVETRDYESGDVEGETKWLSITKKEMLAIRKMLSISEKGS